jgi:alkanesulfonate monooxygenase SsuD/methylene tetrahydromethanopterin reductase-like flavin-dependent oxidoreductase (luciferase family)
MEHRERWREGVDLMLKAWTAKEFFAWNGKYNQLPKVNLWPRPIQEPHPPVLIPGAASSSTWDYCHERNFPYAYLSYFGGKSAENVMDRFWERAAAKGKDANPYRAAFLQIVGVGETDRKAEEEFGRHVEYFYHKLLHQPLGYIAPPGNADYKSLLNVLMSGKQLLQIGDFTTDLKPLKAKDMMEKEFVVVGSPATVRDKLEAMAKRLNVGHLMVALQFGSMPHGQAKKNIELFAREVLPHLQATWEDKNWENHWWPRKLRRRPAQEQAHAMA